MYSRRWKKILNEAWLYFGRLLVYLTRKFILQRQNNPPKPPKNPPFLKNLSEIPGAIYLPLWRSDIKRTDRFDMQRALYKCEIFSWQWKIYYRRRDMGRFLSSGYVKPRKAGIGLWACVWVGSMGIQSVCLCMSE